MPLQTINQDRPSGIFSTWAKFFRSFVFEVGSIDTIRIDQATEKKARGEANLLLRNTTMLVAAQDISDHRANARGKIRVTHQLSTTIEDSRIGFLDNFVEMRPFP